MPGLFLSYSRADRALAHQFTQALRDLGIEIWWDEDMAGVDWQEELSRRIQELNGVVVLWTPQSLQSRNVRDEARLGDFHGKLINVLSGVEAPPFPFDRINGLPLDGFGGAEARGWTRIVETVETFSVKFGAAQPGEIMARLRARNAELDRLATAIRKAERALEAATERSQAQAAELQAADAALAAAMDQQRQVSALRVSASVLLAANDELEAAKDARDAVKAKIKSATDEVGQARRSLAEAQAAFESARAPSVPKSKGPGPKPEPPKESEPPVLDDPPPPVKSNRQLVWAGLAVAALLGALLLSQTGMFDRRDAPADAAAVAAATAADAAPPPDPVLAEGRKMAEAMAGTWNPAEHPGACVAAAITFRLTGEELQLALQGYDARHPVSALKDGWLPFDGGLWRVVGERLQVTQPGAGGSPTEYVRCG